MVLSPLPTRAWARSTARARPSPPQLTLPNVRVDGRACFAWTVFAGATAMPSLRAGAIAAANVECRGEIDLSAAESGGDVDLSGATLARAARFASLSCKGALLASKAHFCEDATFAHAKVGGDLKIDGARFDGPATFRSLVVGGGVAGTSATFAREANFGAARIGAGATLTGSHFTGAAQFGAVQTGGSLECGAAAFDADADFRGARIGGSASFDKAVFARAALFDGAEVRGALGMRAARLQGEVRCNDVGIAGGVDASGATFGGDTLFHRISAGKDSSFDDATFAARAEFSGATFGEGLQLRTTRFDGPADFEGASVQSDMLCSGARFGGDARFDAAHIGGQLDCSGAAFARRAIFDGADVTSDLLCERASFAAETRFVGSRVGRDAVFSDATFEAPLDLRWMHFRGLRIGERAAAKSVRAQAVSGRPARGNGELTPAPAPARSSDHGLTLDLRGGHFVVLQSASQAPSDDAVFPARAVDKGQRGPAHSPRAQARMAADAFYMRRELEGDAIRPFRNPPWTAACWADLLRLLGDRVLRAIPGYGVRPWRMLAWLLAPVLIAFLIFAFVPGSAVPADGRINSTATTAACDERAPLDDAAALGIATYASLDPALLTSWRVSGCGIPGSPVTAASSAGLLRAAGWLLIPFALLTFTGVLRRLLGFHKI